MCSQPEDTNSESRIVMGTREAFDEIQDNILARMIDFQYTETD